MCKTTRAIPAMLLTSIAVEEWRMRSVESCDSLQSSATDSSFRQCDGFPIRAVQ